MSLTVNYLIDHGLVASTLKCFDLTKIQHRSVSEFEKGLDTLPESLVVMDNVKWVACKDGDPNHAKEVYSSDGNVVCCWDRDKQTAMLQKLVNGFLATIKLIKKEEEITMAEIDAGLSMDALDNLGAPMTEDLGALPTMDAFGGDVAAVPAGEIRQKENFQAANNAYFTFVKSFGRFHAFITRSEAAIKVSKTNRKILKNGVPVLDPTSEPDAEVVKKYQENPKSLPLKYCKKDQVVGFKEAKPSTIVGGIISYPKGAIKEADFFGSIMNRKPVDFDQSQQDLEYTVLSQAQLNAAVAMMFHGTIQEDERVVGPTAGWLQLVQSKIPSKGDTPVIPGQEQYRLSLKLHKEYKRRKSMITDDNYIPLSIYDKYSVQDLDENKIKALNTAIEATIKSVDVYDKLSADTKAKIHWNAKNSDAPVTSEYFKAGGKGEPIHVYKFWDSSVEERDVCIPYKIKKNGKEGKVSYSFVTFKLADEKGPLSDPRFARILDILGMDKVLFMEDARKLTKKASSKSKANGPSVDDYLAALSNDAEERARYQAETLIDTNELTSILKKLAS